MALRRPDYTDPEQFFAKTFLAANLLDLSAQVVRRMAGETSYTSPVFNLATNFGGGKTHALTLLYHLAKHGAGSHGWLGVSQIKEKASRVGAAQGESGGVRRHRIRLVGGARRGMASRDEQLLGAR